MKSAVFTNLEKAALKQIVPKVNLYEEVANRISLLIDQRVYKTGDRIPSVRALSRQLKVSISTVMEAYRLMEDRGRIEVRPQSGYYVRLPLPILSEPETSAPICEPMSVSSELVTRVRRDSSNPNLLNLGAATPNPELLPLDKLSRTLAAVVRQDNSLGGDYDVPPGCEPLRVQIVRRMLQAGCTLTPDQIVITSGCQEAISLSLKAVCRSGDTVAIESPMFYGILQAIESQGLRALEIPTHPRDGISIEALANAVARQSVAACLVISNFSNPLGSCIPDANKKSLVELLAKHQIPLIEDDIYGELYFGTERPRVAKSFDRSGNVLFCSSFSKTVAPGYRVGWVAPGKFQTQVEHLKMATNLSTAVPTQMAVAKFLENGGYDHHLRRIRRIYERQVAAMTDAIGRYFPPETKVTRPSGGFVIWIELPHRVDSLELYQMAVKAGITIAPGLIFTAQQKYRNCIRLNAAFWSEKVAGAIEVLGKMAAALKK
ncbi:MAG TPA: PLP-dependent aminotransferase family protein [Pyrinomonadaceae bacterium]